MSTDPIGSAIERAIRICPTSSPIDDDEAKAIIAAAEKDLSGAPSPVTADEAKRIGDLFERQPRYVVRGLPRAELAPLASCPAQPTLSMHPLAVHRFNQFFERNELPYGERLAAQILSKVRQNGVRSYGLERLGPPEKIDRMSHVLLERPEDASFGTVVEAYLDRSTQQFYIAESKVGSPQFRPSPETKWYGPSPMVVDDSRALKPKSFTVLSGVVRNQGTLANPGPMWLSLDSPIRVGDVEARSVRLPISFWNRAGSHVTLGGRVEVETTPFRLGESQRRYVELTDVSDKM